MTEKDIVRLAEESGLWLHTDRQYEAVEKFANIVAAAENEACAKLMDEMAVKDKLTNYYKVAANAIRARGQYD